MYLLAHTKYFFQVFCFIKTYNYTNACETNTESGAIARVGASTPRRPPHALATGKWLRHAARPQDTVASTLTCSLLSPSVSHRQPSSMGSGLTLTLPSLRNTKAGIFRTQLGGSNLLFGATEAAMRSLCQSAVSTRKADSGPGRWRGGTSAVLEFGLLVFASPSSRSKNVRSSDRIR